MPVVRRRRQPVCGGLSGLGRLFTVGSVTVRGEPGKAVRVVLPASVTLRAPNGASATITQLTIDLPAGPRPGKDESLGSLFGDG